MANQAGIAIGINRYQFFQPLGYAQDDAQALHDFLVKEAGFLPERCLLLTDTSPTIEQQSTYPNTENIFKAIDRFCQEPAPPEDLLWFFFSGYGVTVDGQDYLMPIDGNPAEILETGISVRSIFKQLKSRGEGRILVLLDINRSSSLQGSAAVGQETVQLAKEMGIPTVLSCQMDQFSQETGGLGHGLFTAALLEALRDRIETITLEGVDQYLRDRLPELAEHHLRPAQTPLTVIPSPEAGHQLILAVDNSRPQVGSTEVAAVADSSQQSEVAREPSANSNISPPVPIATTAKIVPQQEAIVPYSQENPPVETEKSPWWGGLAFWGGSAAVLVALTVGVFLRNQEAFTSQPPSGTPIAATSPSPATNPPTAPLQLGKPAASPSAQKTNLVPVTTPKQPSPPSAEGNQETLDKARALIQPNQASQFSKAIAVAQKIKPGEPLYNQAKSDIQRWSAVILDLAQGRAEKGQFLEAIAAAKLVPTDNQDAYTKAQESIVSWQKLAQQQRANQTILAAAKGLVKSRQASTYNQAIATAQKIQPGQPVYAEAQQLIAKWSQDIYQIAESRAATGKFQGAIATADLVPVGTLYYDVAQKAIVKWKQGKR